MIPNQKRHPDAELLERYSFGQLPAREEEPIEEHLLACMQCQDELAQVEASILEMKEACRALRREPEPEPSRLAFLRRLTIPGPVLAGACAAALLAMVVPVMKFRPAVNATAAIVQLDTMRGAADAATAHAPAERPLHLKLNAGTLAEASTYRAEIVNRQGSGVWQGTAVKNSGGLVVDVPTGFSAGHYWVRVFDGPTALQEYGLELR